MKMRSKAGARPRNRLGVILALALTATSACTDDRPGPQTDSAKKKETLVPPPPAINPELSTLLSQVVSPEQDARDAASKRIAEILKSGPSPQDVAAVIAVATSGDIPPSKDSTRATDGDLLRAAWGHADDRHVQTVVDGFAQLSEDGKQEALTLLSRIESRASTEAFVQLLRVHGWPEFAMPWMTAAYTNKGLFPELVLPALLDGSIRNLPDDEVDRFIYGYGLAGKLTAETRAQVRPRQIERAKMLLASAEPYQRKTGRTWKYEDPYVEIRWQAGLALEVLGHLGTSPASLAVLRRAEEFADTRLRAVASVSLLRLDETPSPTALDAAASDFETRALLYRAFLDAKRLELFPKKHLTQDELAEAEMVEWLTFPTELGRAPDEIELMRRVPVELEDGRETFVYFIFRFRTHEPHWAAKDGWLAGVAGPYKKSEFPTMNSLGYTFSSFTPWQEFDVREHLGSTQELMEQWRDR